MQVIARDPGFTDGVRHQALAETASLRARLDDAPGDLEARVGLARALLESGELGEAFLHLRLASGPGGHRAQASYLMGLAHIWVGDHSAAVDDLLLAVRLLPDSTPALAALDVALAGIVEGSASSRADAGELSLVKNAVRTVDPAAIRPERSRAA